MRKLIAVSFFLITTISVQAGMMVMHNITLKVGDRDAAVALHNQVEQEQAKRAFIACEAKLKDGLATACSHDGLTVDRDRDGRINIFKPRG